MAEKDIKEQDISISKVFSEAWNHIAKDSQLWIKLALIYVLPSVLLALVFAAAFDLDGKSLEDIDLFSSASTATTGSLLLVSLIIGIYQLAITAIYFPVFIQAAAGKNIKDVKQAFDIGKPRAFRVILAILAVGILVALGFVLLIIPGIIAFFMLAFTVYIMADTDKTIGASMKLSTKYASTFLVPILLFVLALFGLNILVSIFVSIFNSLPYAIYGPINTSLQAGIQLFTGVAGAGLYLAMKKRYKEE